MVELIHSWNQPVLSNEGKVSCQRVAGLWWVYTHDWSIISRHNMFQTYKLGQKINACKWWKFIPVALKKLKVHPKAPLLESVNVLFKVSSITVVPNCIMSISTDNWRIRFIHLFYHNMKNWNKSNKSLA